MSNHGDSTINFTTLKPEEFEQILPELFGEGKLSQDPRLHDFLARHPDCAALVRDLETIAETARSLFAPTEEPSDRVWSKIQSKLREQTGPSAANGEDKTSADPDDDGDGVREID